MTRRFIAVTFSTLSFLAFAPASALADGSPTLNPSLPSTLAPPPDSYTATASGRLQGNFRASDYAATWGSDATIGLNDLQVDGFVAGYGLAKADTATGRIMAEFVMAFMGQRGAVRFLASEKAENLASPHFQHTDPAAGLGNDFFGVREAQASPPLLVDAFEFVKGNDLFGVGLFAAKDDSLLARAQLQAIAQYNAAPAATIPQDLWLENQAATAGDTGFSLGSGPEIFIGLAVVAALLAVGVFVWMRQRELEPEKPKVLQQMTADGQYWFNGTYWIATSEMAPPWAQRSKDGAFWWDGRMWQAVPRAPAPTRR